MGFLKAQSALNLKKNHHFSEMVNLNQNKLINTCTCTYIFKKLCVHTKQKKLHGSYIGLI